MLHCHVLRLSKGGRDNLCSIHVPCNGHVGVPNSPISPLAVLLSTSLLSSSSSQMTHLEKTQKPAAGDNGPENSPGVIWFCLGPGWWVAVFLSCLTSQHLKLFSCSCEACDTGGIFPLAGAYWHVGALLGWWETGVSHTQRQEHSIWISWSVVSIVQSYADKYKAYDIQEWPPSVSAPSVSGDDVVG